MWSLRTLLAAAACALASAAPMALAAPAGELTIAQSPLLQRYDPINQVTTTDYFELSLLFDGLVNLGPKGMYPALATEWKMSEDGKTIDFQLREGVKFSNGDPLTGEDVAFTYKSIVGDSAHGYRTIFAESIKDVEVLGPYRVRFHMLKPWAAFFDEVRGGGVQAIVPKKYYQEVGAKGFQAKPVGTGPYRLESIKTGEWTRYVANEGYWQGSPGIRFVTQRLVKEPFTRLAQVMSGEADIATGITGPLLTRVTQNPNLRVIYAKYNGTNSLHFRRDTNPLFKDKRARLAIAHAIDRQGMAASILGGLCEPATHYFTPATFGYKPDLSLIPYDLKRAKELLAEAGFKPGYETDFILHTEEFGSSPNGPAMLEAIAGVFDQLGFKVTRKNYDTAAFLRGQRARNYTGVFYGTSVIPIDGGGLMSSYYITSSIPGNGQVSVPEYDRIYEAQLVETDPAKRRALLQRFAELEHENIEAVPLFWCHASFVVGPKVGELHPGFGSSYHLNMHLAKLK